MKKVIKFFKDVKQEMKFVSWPNKEDIKEGTIVVIVMSIIVGIFLFAVDSGFSMLMNALLLKG